MGYSQDPRLAYKAFEQAAKEHRAAGEPELAQVAEHRAEELRTLYEQMTSLAS